MARKRPRALLGKQISRKQRDFLPSSRIDDFYLQNSSYKNSFLYSGKRRKKKHMIIYTKKDNMSYKSAFRAEKRKKESVLDLTGNSCVLSVEINCLLCKVSISAVKDLFRSNSSLNFILGKFSVPLIEFWFTRWCSPQIFQFDRNVLCLQG